MDNASQNSEPYSTMEVVRDNFHSAPEVDHRHDSDKEAFSAYNSDNGISKSFAYSSKPKRRVCGMRKPIALLVFGVSAVVVIGAVVGGVVGGVLMNSHSGDLSTVTPKGAIANSTATSVSNVIGDPSITTSSPVASSLVEVSTTVPLSSSTATSTSSAPATSTSGMGTYDCPESNGTEYTTSSGTGAITYMQLCGIDWPGGLDAAEGSITTTVEDLSVVLVYSLHDCIDQCAVYTLNNFPGCYAVTYGANVTLAQSRGAGGNCYLKSAIAASPLIDNSGQEQAAFVV